MKAKTKLAPGKQFLNNLLAFKQQGRTDKRDGKQRQQLDSGWKQEAYDLGYGRK